MGKKDMKLYDEMSEKDMEELQKTLSQSDSE